MAANIEFSNISSK